ncbi:hypothetical protein [Modestobacter versicolor]|uniref:hypothetical protein n=1 Tax=Modestobacter versicolor TaxID=429133 RepID=UPI0034DFA42E
MTRPSDDVPTTVIPQQTVEQPAVTTAPATRRAGLRSHVPARIGRARTSTVVIGCLFVLGLGLNAALPREEDETVPVTTSDGRTVDVPRSALPDDYVPPTPTPTPAAPSSTTPPAPTSTPAPTSQAPQSTAEEDEETTPAPAPTTRSQGSTSAPSSTRPSTTSRAPASSAERTVEDEPTATPSESTG